MKKILSFLLLAFIPVSVLFAQDKQMSKHNNLKLAIEFGANIMNGELVKPEQIRENRSAGYYYGDEYYNCGFFSEHNLLNTKYFGIKPEYFIFNNRIGLASGLRYTITSSDLISDRDNFLWKIKEDGLVTDYVRIDEIRQKNHLLGIPLEIRFFANKRDLPFQHYFKIGASFNYLIYSEKHQVIFADYAMSKYENIVQNQMPKNNEFSSFFYGAVGFKIGKYRHGSFAPWGNIEFQFPYMLLTDNSFAFTGKGNSLLGLGVQLSFEIPIGKNEPIGSKYIIY